MSNSNQQERSNSDVFSMICFFTSVLICGYALLSMIVEFLWMDKYIQYKAKQPQGLKTACAYFEEKADVKTYNYPVYYVVIDDLLINVMRSTPSTVPLIKKEKMVFFRSSLDSKQKACHKVQYVQTGFDFLVLPKSIRLFQPNFFPFKNIYLYDYLGADEE